MAAGASAETNPKPPARISRRWWVVGSIVVLVLVTASAAIWVQSRANAWQDIPIVAVEPVGADRAIVLRVDELPARWHLALMNAEGEPVWHSMLGEGDMRARTEHVEGEPRLTIAAGSGVGILGTSYGFDLDTGATRWRYAGPPRSADPLVKSYFLHEGVLLALYPAEIVAVDVATGAERFRMAAPGLRRFFRLPGSVLLQTDGSNDAAAIDLKTGEKRPLTGPLCRIGEELLALRHDGSSVHDAATLESLRTTKATFTGFAKPRCGAYRDMLVAIEVSKVGAHLLALDSESLEKRWQVELRPPPGTPLEVPVAERVAMMDPLPQFMPVRIGNKRQIVDLETGKVAHELDLTTLPGDAHREGYLAAGDHFYAIDGRNISRLKRDSVVVEATATIWAANQPRIGEGVVWVYDGARLGRLHQDTLAPMKGSEWITDPDAGSWPR
jgi:hypothetical protein